MLSYQNYYYHSNEDLLMQVADAEIDALWLIPPGMPYQVSEVDTKKLHQWGVGGGKRNQGHL